MLIPNLASDFAGNICSDLYGDINTQKNFQLVGEMQNSYIPTFKVFRMENLCEPSNYIKSK